MPPLAALLACALVLLPSPAAGSMPGGNGELLVFGHVGDERGLYLVDLDPLSRTKLPIEVDDLDLYSAAWSPSGSHIAFTRYDPGSDEHGLWVYEMASGETRLLRTAEPGVEFTDVSWSPSGDELVVGTIRQIPAGWVAGLARVSPEGALIDEISLPAEFVWRVEWSPSRPELLLWLGWRGGAEPHESICLLSVETADLDCIVDDAWWPGWSPDGELIALGTGPTSHLTIVDRSGNVVDEFDSVTGHMTSWSPDGRFIAYPQYLGEPEVGQYSLETMNLDTLERHGYVVGIRNVLDLRWRPTRPTSGFLDVPDDYVFANDVTWLADSGYTVGCNPPLSTEFCPARPVTRGELAALLHRTLDDDLIPIQTAADFVDMADSLFAADIAWLSSTGLTRGCNPPANDRFCPDDPVTRGQLAAFLVRAMDYRDDSGGDLFGDDDGSVFEHDIDRLGTAGVTLGCNPPVNDRFCPNDFVTRGQMAAFLNRALNG